MSKKDEISLRPVTDADREFLLRAYAASREIELSMVPWDAAMKLTFVEHQFDAQTRHYRDEYPHATHDIIMFGDKPAGRLYVDRGEDMIAILDMVVLPGFRKKGIGTGIINDLTAEAGALGKTVRVFVETFNPSGKLFLDLGFAVAEDVGLDLRLEWRTLPK